ncbi:MAG: fructose-bisphosphate aldolase, partial [Chloroflexi bacterium]|nr:fructose-bisphosphate aldolase [Chloroflexota bacterium]
MTTNIQSLLGSQAESLLGFNSPKISKERLHLPGPDFIDRVFLHSDRNPRVLNNLAWIYNSGRLAGTG